MPWFRPRVNADAIVDYSAFQYTLGEHTFFDGVKRLLPGHRVTISLQHSQEPRQEKYWSLRFDDEEVRHLPDESFYELIRGVLTDSVEAHSPADVAVGSYLSGGLDSSIVAILAARRQAEPLDTFSVAFRQRGFDESPYARSVSRHIGSIHRTTYAASEDLPGILPRLIYHMDEPAAGPGLFPQYIVSKTASEHVKVVLSGLGGDEVAGGYVRYYAALWDSAWRDAVHNKNSAERPGLASLSKNLHQLAGYEGLLQPFLAGGIFESDAHRYFRLVCRAEPREFLNPDFLHSTDRDPFEVFKETFDRPRTTSYLNRMLYFDGQGMLPALLQVEDRVSMAVSIESRVPLLEPQTGGALHYSAAGTESARWGTSVTTSALSGLLAAIRRRDAPRQDGLAGSDGGLGTRLDSRFHCRHSWKRASEAAGGSAPSDFAQNRS